MGKILAEYPSKSKPGKSYYITEPNNGGDPYCDCWQWKRNRTCQHLQDYLNNGAPEVEEQVAVSPVEDEIDAAIKKVLGSVK